MDPETFTESKLILLWGTNPLTSGHHVFKFIRAAQKRGAHLVSIDPLRTRTSERCDEWLAPLPGTDAALALGLMWVIVDMGAEDRSYLAAHTHGWEQFKQRVLEFPPDRVASITGLDEARIVELGQRIATTRPTGIRCTQGMQRHAGGGAALRMLYALPGVTGDWQYPGGGASYSTSGRFTPDWAGVFRDDLVQAPVRTLNMTNLAADLLTRDDPPVKALIVYQANPMGSNPDTQRVREGLLREDLFTVVMEQFPTDTVDYADIVLPSTMQTEHLDLNDGYGHSYIHLNRKAVEPPGECLSTMETLPAAGVRDESRGARAVPQRRGARARADRRRRVRGAVGAGLEALPAVTVRALHRGLPDALGQAGVRLREGRGGRTRPDARLGPSGADRRRGAPAGADRPRLALVPEHDLRQQARPDGEGRRPADHAAPGGRRRARACRRATWRGCSTPAASSSRRSSSPTASAPA